MTPLEVETAPDAAALGARAAGRIAAAARAAVVERGRFVLAVSGGRTPGLMLRALAGEALPWDRVDIVQVDERVAPDGHPDRNASLLAAHLTGRVPIPPEHVHLMDVTATDLEAAADAYAAELAGLTGGDGVDLVHLGLGDDGHTASWPPGDPVGGLVGPDDPDVVVVGPFHGRRRMTLTPAAVNRARSVLWLIDGPARAPILRRLLAGDPSIPASRVRRDRAVVLAAGRREDFPAS